MHINDIPSLPNFEDIKAAFDRLYDKQGDCRIWKGIVDGRGYGQFSLPGESQRHGAHRLSFRIYNGFIPDDRKLICHTCDVKLCGEPSHLFNGTHADNSDDKVAKGRQHRPTGTINGRCVLTPAEVRSIYMDPRSIRDVAAGLRVSKAQVQRIRAGKQWRHVTSGLIHPRNG